MEIRGMHKTNEETDQTGTSGEIYEQYRDTTRSVRYGSAEQSFGWAVLVWLLERWLTFFDFSQSQGCISTTCPRGTSNNSAMAARLCQVVWFTMRWHRW